MLTRRDVAIVQISSLFKIKLGEGEMPLDL